MNKKASMLRLPELLERNHSRWSPSVCRFPRSGWHTSRPDVLSSQERLKFKVNSIALRDHSCVPRRGTERRFPQFSAILPSRQSAQNWPKNERNNHRWDLTSMVL